MRFGSVNRWIEINYYSWENHKFYFSKLIDGAIISWLRITIIMKLKVQ